MSDSAHGRRPQVPDPAEQKDDVMGGAQPKETDPMGGAQPKETDPMGGAQPEETDVMGGPRRPEDVMRPRRAG